MQASSVNQIMMVVPTLSPSIIIIPIIGAKQMVKSAEKRNGSWCLAWLVTHGSAKRASPPTIEKQLLAAPGTYVMNK